MLIRSRHNRPGPVVAQSPHNNPPRPRLSPLLPPPAAARAPLSAAPRATPPPVSLRPAGRFRPAAGGGRRGRGRGSPARRPAGQPQPCTDVTTAEARPPRGFLPRGRSGARAGRSRGRWTLCPLWAEGTRPSREAAATRGARGAAPLFPRGCGSGPPGAHWRRRDLLETVRRAGFSAAGLVRQRRAGVGLSPPWTRAVRPGGLRAPRLRGPEKQARSYYLDAAVFVSGSQNWGLIP